MLYIVPLLDPNTWDRPTLAGANPIVRAAIRNMVLSIVAAILVAIFMSVVTDDSSSAVMVIPAVLFFAALSFISLMKPTSPGKEMRRGFRLLGILVPIIAITPLIYRSPVLIPSVVAAGLAVFFCNRAVAIYFEQEKLFRTSTLCSRCGYDIRKSPDRRDGILSRCPECGHGDPTPE